MIGLLWVLACQGDEPAGGASDGPVDTGSPATTSPSESGTSPATATTANTATTADTAPSVPMVGEALATRCEPAFDAEPPAVSMHRVTLPTARCNDGTPAVLYVRPAADPGVTDWVVYFDGGSRCASGEDCAARWCAEDAYNATKMSSLWAPEQRDIRGLQALDERSQFQGWNHAFVYYCSSDFWLGDAADVVLSTDEEGAFRMHFEGARIVDEAVGWLLAGGASDDGEVEMPPLAEAGRVVWAGSSAGGMAVTQHGDALAAAVAPAPSYVVVDALSTPDPALAYAPGAAEAWDAELQRQWSDEVLPIYSARLHAGCLAGEAAAPWHCWEPSFVHQRYLQAPLFVHHDLRDAVLYDSYGALGVTLPGYIHASMALLEGLAALEPAVAVHGPSCGTHTTLSADGTFHDQSVQGVSMHDGLVSWLEGGVVSLIDPGPGNASTCR